MYTHSHGLQAGRRPTLRAAISLVLATASAATYAQTATEPRQLPKVSVEAEEPTGYQTERSSSAKVTVPLRDEPRTITVVPQKLIEERGAATLTEALRNVPGITLVAGEGGGARGDQFRIRGFAAQNDLFFDGMREVAQFSNRDPFNLQAVEVSKGPDSAFGGRGSTGGAINQVSKLPSLDQAFSSTLALGTADYRRATADFNQPLADGTAFRLNAMYHDAEVEGRDVAENSRWGVAPTMAFGLDSPTRLVLGYYHLDQDNVTDYGLPTTQGQLLVDVDRSNWYGFAGLNGEDSVARVGTARIEHDVNDAVSVRSQFRYAENDLWSVVTAPRNADPLANTVARNPNVRDSINTLAINQTDATIEFATGAVRHSVVTGVEFSRELYKTRAYTLTPTAPLDNLTDPDPNTPYAPVFNGNGSTENTGDTLGAFAFDTLSIGERWHFNAGLRWDRFDVTSEGISNVGAVSVAESRDSMTSWRAGIVYKPRANGSVYLVSGTSFNPSAETGVITAANSTLEPEESRTIEVGTKWDVLDERLSLTAALFRTEKTNARTPGLPGEPPTVLDGEQRVDGVELGFAGSVSDGWSVFGGYAYMDSEIVESNNPLEAGNEIGNTPPHTFNLWTTYTILPSLEVSFGAQFISERTVSNTVTTELDAFWLLDASASYTFSDHMGLYLNVYNLADEEYFDRLHGGGSHAIPAPGRTAQLRLAVSW